MRDYATFTNAIIATKELADLTRQKAALLDKLAIALERERAKLERK